MMLNLSAAGDFCVYMKDLYNLELDRHNFHPLGIRIYWTDEEGFSIDFCIHDL